MPFDPSTAAPVDAAPEASGGFDPSTATPEDTQKGQEPTQRQKQAMELAKKAGPIPIPPSMQQAPQEAPKETTVFKEVLQKAANIDPRVGGAEAVANVISQMPGFGAYIVGGLTGLVAEAFGMPKGYAKDLADRASGNLTYEPKTEQGKQQAAVANYPLQKFTEGTEVAGQKIARTAGSEYDEQIKHVEKFGAPKWFSGTKEEYLARLKADQKKAEDAGALEGALVESTGQMVGGELIGRGGAKVAGKAAEALKGKGDTLPTKEIPDRPAEGATEAQKQAYKDRIKEIIKERKESSPLKETAIRNKETGEIERMGPKHDEARKEATKDTHEQGFMTERGDFLTRKEAYEQAKRTGMLDKNHDPNTLSFPEEGLHSGDLRAAGVERFQVKEDEKIPTGETKEIFDPETAKVEEPPKHTEEGPPPEEQHEESLPASHEEKGLQTRQEFKEHINDLERQYLDHLDNDRHGKAERIKRMMDHAEENMPPPEIKNAKAPTDAEMRDVMWNVRDVGTALERMQQQGLGHAHFRALFDAMSSLEGLKGVKIEFTDKQLRYISKDGTERNAVGLFWSKGLDGKGHPHVQVGKGGSVPTMIHEIAHAATSNILKDPNSAAALRIKQIFQDYKDQIGDQLVDPNHPEKGTHYGFTDVDEFVSEVFSNWKFKTALDQIKLPGEKTTGPVSLWTKFKDAIAQVMHIDRDQRTGLDEALEASFDLMKEQDERFKQRDTSKINTEPVVKPLASESEVDTGSEKLDDLVGKIDVRTIPDKKSFLEHATNIYETHGEDAAMAFFEAYSKEVKERQIPVPENNKDLDHNFHTMDGFTMADKSEMVTGYKDSTKAGVSDYERKVAFDAIEEGATPKAIPGKLGEVLDKLHQESKALVRKAKAMGLKVGDEFETGQNRIRLFGAKDKIGKVWQDFFSNKTPFGEKVAEKANAAHERKVFGIKGTRRVVELHRIQKEYISKYKDPKTGKIINKVVKPGTQIWEWVKDKDGNKTKKLIGHDENLEFGKGDITPTLDGTTHIELSDGSVHDIEKMSPYKYLHDAEASARLALMGLRKYVREAEYFKNLTESDLFKQVGHSPKEGLETLPKGWRVPNNIDRIPQLRGWHFDPKTAAIIEDFAKVWDNNSWMKLTNQIVKAIMLNPLPHMMNELMHLWNARGFTGWVSPKGLSRLSRTGLQAWKDVANQTPFYRELMTQGGSILGATPRNAFFEHIVEHASKEAFKDEKIRRGLKQIAVKTGTTVADLYNGISRKSQQAMWFTRDVMYTQYVREVMEQHEKRTGETLSIKEATEKVGEHMPTYHLPSEVLGSRKIAQVLKNPNLSTFSSYHYGVLNSLLNTLKDMNPKNLKDEAGRQRFKDGIDTAIAIGVASYVLYPLADKFAEMLFGEGATVRRAGPYHVLEGVTAVAKGEKDLTGLLWPVFSFNPMLAIMGQLALNKTLFTGKQIYHPDDTVQENIEDVGKWALKQAPQVDPMMKAASEEGGAAAFIGKQLDVKVPSEKQRTVIERAKKRQEIAHKAREKARQHGKYNQ